MEKHFKKVTVSKAKADFIRRCLEQHMLGEDDTVSVTAVFDDGMEMDVKCCGVKDDDCFGEPAWTEAVLFNKEGAEAAFTEPEEEFFGEWHITYNGSEYVACVAEA